MIDFPVTESCKFPILLGSQRGCSECSVDLQRAVLCVMWEGGRAGSFSTKAMAESRRKDLSLDLGHKCKVC